jgi:hypothetical protein
MYCSNLCLNFISSTKLIQHRVKEMVFEGMNGIHLAQDMVQCQQSAVSIVINIPSPHVAGNFVNS